ncbi:response regulator transcription factor [Roseomonas sp. NAR14]|uniref:Response regulator transcription factor n=1 Tax=Roseomonas acroporae TaxID=2937791 RepID=A0A9X1YCH6_9PROT|nr:response regulator transcription factor [Roseomonas acroporae]MCK8786182.1 response regulator transcription factor [Roseomonas acroporae]
MRVLVVEDNAALAAQLRAALAEARFAVDHAPDGEEALFLGETEPYDAVVLDLGLPRLDGLSVLRRWRAAGRAMPVLILTARAAWTEKVEGLNAGADDYLAKPFAMGELVARLQALIRRSHGLASAAIALDGPWGQVRLDIAAGSVTRDGAPVRLTALEFKLLAYLAHRRGGIVSKTELTEHLYEQDFDRDSNTLEVMVGRLRRKLGERLIETVRGQGYRLPAAAA